MTLPGARYLAVALLIVCGVALGAALNAADDNTSNDAFYAAIRANDLNLRKIEDLEDEILVAMEHREPLDAELAGLDEERARLDRAASQLRATIASGGGQHGPVVLSNEATSFLGIHTG